MKEEKNVQTEMSNDEMEVMNNIMKMIDVSTMTEEEKEVLAHVAYFAISHEFINPAELSYKFGVNGPMIDQLLRQMLEQGIIKIDDENKRIVAADELPTEIMNIVKKYYSEEDIEHALKGDLKKEEKKVTSRALNDKKYEWISVDDKLPEDNEPKVIRIVNYGQMISESKTEIEYVEAIYIASYNEKWSITGPYLAYDLSGMTNKEAIKDDENIKVTHWAEPSEEYLDRWLNRFDLIGDYTEMEFKVSKDHEEEVYKALTFASRSLFNTASTMNDDNKLKKSVVTAYKVLADIQSTIDKGGKNAKTLKGVQHAVEE